MKNTLRAGIDYELEYRVPENKTVPHLYPESAEYRQMPQVFATGFMVGLVEWACILAVNPHLDWPTEQTVGTHVDLSHVAATPPGLVVTVRVTLREVDGRRLLFDAEAHDGIDTITRGRHERYIIDAARFSAKANEKARSAGR